MFSRIVPQVVILSGSRWAYVMGIQEVIGLPTYFIDTAIPEDAGNGNVRVINCVTRNGVLIPQYECIIHSTRLIVAGRAVAMKAQLIFNDEMVIHGTAH